MSKPTLRISRAAGSGAVARQVAAQPRLHGRAGQAGGAGHLHPRRVAQTCHGGGACVRACVRVSVCVCVRESERERESGWVGE